MSTRKPKLGNRYLTATGTPVQVLEVHDEGIVLQSLASDSRFCLPGGYPLLPFNQDMTAWDVRPSLYTPRSERPKPARPAAQKQLAPIIDALLLEGGRTMRGLVREVKRRASSACKGKNVRVNIRARVYWLKKSRGVYCNGMIQAASGHGRNFG